MARLAGYAGSFKECATGGSPAEVLGITSWTIDVAGDVDDVTGFDGVTSSVNERTYVAGLASWKGTVEGVWDSDEVDYEDATPPPLLKPGTAVDLLLELVDGGDYYSGAAIVTSFAPKVGVDGAVSFSASYQGTGALTYPA